MAHIREEEWELQKEHIEELYLTQNRYLKDVMALMQKQHNFNATEKMYKTRFKAWKWRKYRSHKAEHTSQSREASNPVHPMADAPAQPRPGQRITRVNPPRFDGSMSNTERVFKIVSNYSEACCRDGTWGTPNQGHLITPPNPAHPDADLTTFVSCWITGLSPHTATLEETRRELEKACELIPTLVVAQHPHIIRAAFEMLRYYNMAGYYDFARVVMEYFSETAKYYLGRTHPLALLFHYITCQGQENLDDVILAALQCGLHVIAREFEPCTFRMVQSRISIPRLSPVQCVTLLGGGLGGGVTIRTRQILVDDASSKTFSHFDEMLLESLSHQGLNAGEEEELVVDLAQYAGRLRNRQCVGIFVSIFVALRDATHALGRVEEVAEETMV